MPRAALGDAQREQRRPVAGRQLHRLAEGGERAGRIAGGVARGAEILLDQELVRRAEGGVGEQGQFVAPDRRAHARSQPQDRDQRRGDGDRRRARGRPARIRANRAPAARHQPTEGRYRKRSAKGAPCRGANPSTGARNRNVQSAPAAPRLPGGDEDRRRRRRRDPGDRAGRQGSCRPERVQRPGRRQQAQIPGDQGGQVGEARAEVGAERVGGRRLGVAETDSRDQQPHRQRSRGDRRRAGQPAEARPRAAVLRVDEAGSGEFDREQRDRQQVRGLLGEQRRRPARRRREPGAIFPAAGPRPGPCRPQHADRGPQIGAPRDEGHRLHVDRMHREQGRAGDRGRRRTQPRAQQGEHEQGRAEVEQQVRQVEDPGGAAAEPAVAPQAQQDERPVVAGRAVDEELGAEDAAQSVRGGGLQVSQHQGIVPDQRVSQRTGVGRDGQRSRRAGRRARSGRGGGRGTASRSSRRVGEAWPHAPGARAAGDPPESVIRRDGDQPLPPAGPRVYAAVGGKPGGSHVDASIFARRHVPARRRRGVRPDPRPPARTCW